MVFVLNDSNFLRLVTDYHCYFVHFGETGQIIS